MSTVAFIGFGELARSLAPAFAAAGHEVRAWSRSLADSTAVTVVGSLEDAVRGAALVVSAVPSAAAPAVATSALAVVESGSCFADLTASAPADKEAAALAAAARGVLYADGAVLGTVAASGHAVPIVASGTGAGKLVELAAGSGMRIDAISGDAGHAARLKLVRSVFMKGRDALVLEMMLAARRLGIEDEVAASIGGPGEEVPFPELAERVLRALAVHSGRRADELDSSAAVLREAGVAPIVTEASAERLRRLAALELRERLGGERPADRRATLDAAAGVPPPS